MLWWLLGRHGCSFIFVWFFLLIFVGGTIGYIARFLGFIDF